MRSDFEQRLHQINWAAYETAYGQANNIPMELARLAGDDHDAAMDASHQLWCGLCHQHAYISSAALPAYPFIVEVLDTANDELAVEILDILTGFAFRSTRGPDGSSPVEWECNLRKQLRDQLPQFQALAKHHNVDVADFAKKIVENLTQYVE